MENVRFVSKIRSNLVDKMSNGKCLPGYQNIGCHMIFEINMDGKFTRKSRLVAGGYTAATYSRVISRESVSIIFMTVEINDIDVYATNIGNTYLNAPCQ